MYDIPTISSDKAFIQGPRFVLEEALNEKRESIESWFTVAFEKHAPIITSSVDLRHAGFKLSPVDTNLFPAGFNNLQSSATRSALQAIQKFFVRDMRAVNPLKVLLIPENHTRNIFYNRSLYVLFHLLQAAHLDVRIGSLDSALQKQTAWDAGDGKILHIHPLIRRGNIIGIDNFTPDRIILNNDLSSGLPVLLANIAQPILPPLQLGWFKRLKSTHFMHYEDVSLAFAKHCNIDPWLISPYFASVDDIDFMEKKVWKH